MPTINLTITDTTPNLDLGVATLDEYFGRNGGETDTQLAQRWLDSLYAVLKTHGFTWGLTPTTGFRTSLIAALENGGFPKIDGENDSVFLRRWVIHTAKGIERAYRKGLVTEDSSGMV